MTPYRNRPPDRSYDRTRVVTVDGVRLRWVVSRSGSWQRTRIEHVAGQGQALVLVHYEVDGTRAPIVTPRSVVSVIRYAQELGWQPEVPGYDFLLDAAELLEARPSEPGR